jgi:hypothetical protein
MPRSEARIAAIEAKAASDAIALLSRKEQLASEAAKKPVRSR